ncbi:hypothetical protein Hanom_Chr10g00899531 [Helianthus anomalus]
MDNKSSQESDKCSFDGRDDEDYNMADDVEEGEIRSPEVAISAPEKEVRSSSEPQKDPVHEPSPDNEEMDNVRVLHEMHGECSIPKEPNNNYEGTDGMEAGDFVGGPQLQEERDFGFVDQSKQDGPTPMAGLGKRNRANRSPPSSGSMQGPPTRGYNQDPITDELPFDLNRPSIVSGSFSGEPLGGVSQV